MIIKPMRAENWIPAKVKLPVWAEPKIDGCRAINMDGTLTARTLKQHKNRYTTEFYSRSEYIGFDGELAAETATHPSLCRLTSSAISTIEGAPYTLWHLFDYVTEETRHWPYAKRYLELEKRIQFLQSCDPIHNRLRIVPVTVCNSMQELMAAHERHMELGYEGTCFYGPNVTHKEGKSSPTHNGVLRIKDFVDAEAEVIEIIEGDTNLNEQQTNELGRAYRTSHKDGKVASGMIGTINGRILADVYDNQKNKVLEKDQIVNIGPGKMTHEERAYYLANPDKIIKHIIKFKLFPKGIKELPRFPTFESFRSKEDL